MKINIKNSYKKLLAVTLFAMSNCVVKADFWNNEPKEDPKRNLTVIYNAIAALGTPDDSSGLYNILTELLANDATIIAKLCMLAANDAIMLHKLCEILANDTVIMHKLCEIIANDTVIMQKLCEILANDSMILHKLCEILSNNDVMMHKLCEILANDSAILHKLCEILSNDTVITHKLCEILSNDAVMMQKLCMIFTNTNTIITDLNTITTDIVNLGTISDASGLFELLTLIIFNLQLDPVLQVVNALNSPAIQTTLTNADPNLVAIAELNNYYIDLAAAVTATVLATTPATEMPANTQLALNAVTFCINNFNILASLWNVDGYYEPTSPYSVARIKNALAQLFSTLTYMLAQQPAF